MNRREQHLGISARQLDRLLDRSRQRLNYVKGGREKSFSDWVYRLEHSVPPTSTPNKAGFLTQARRNVSNVLDRLVDGEVAEWNLVSCDDGTAGSPIYESKILYFDGKPIKIRPDAVFKKKTEDLWVIFEYKIPTPGIVVPSEGWPSLAAQLWSYCWAGPWARSPNVLLVGVIFDWNGVEATLGKIWPRTMKTDRDLSNSCKRLFQAWGGDIRFGL